MPAPDVASVATRAAPTNTASHQGAVDLVSMLPGMADAAWRALAYCLHPRVIWLSLAPILLAGGALALLAWWGWADGVAAVQRALETWGVSHHVLAWLDKIGLSGMRAAVAPLILVMLAVPLVLMTCLLVVASVLSPKLAALVRLRRFPHLQPKAAVRWWRSLMWSSWVTAQALLLLALTLPLWLFPLFALVLPPLIWGWLTYRVMVFDVLSELATEADIRRLMRQYRIPLLAIGVVCGYLGAAPAALWALGALTVYLAPLMLIASVWLYTLVFIFSGLWFAHFLLPIVAAERLPAPLIIEAEAKT